MFVTDFRNVKFWWFLGVADTNDVIQKIEKTLNNTHTTTQKLTNNSFRNTKKHPKFFIVPGVAGSDREVWGLSIIMLSPRLL